MGRELRRVPPSWEHPTNDRGHYLPLLDEDYETAKARWDANNALWERGEHPDQQKSAEARKYATYAEWDTEAPDPAYHRPKWTEEPTAYQLYEDVTEGTPISPVLPTREAVIEWLMKDGRGMGIGGTRLTMTREQAAAWFGQGWSPSFIAVDGSVSVS